MSAERAGDSVQILERGYSDFDSLAESIAGWDLRFRQLDAGDSPAEITQIAAPGVLLSRLRVSRRYDQQGSSPTGMRTFGLLARESPDIRWCGRSFSEGEICSFPDGAEFEAISPPDFDVWTLAFSTEVLAARASELGRPDLPERMEGRWSRPIDPRALGALRETVASVPGLGRAGPSTPEMTDLLTVDIPNQVLDAISSTFDPVAPPPSRLRDRAFVRARDYALGGSPARPSVAGMREASGASWRTLDYAFRERLGVTPQTYLKAVRLDRLRRALRSAARGTRVIEVAAEHGFTHMGQLAADYRAQFCELPSETLARRAAPGPGTGPLPLIS